MSRLSGDGFFGLVLLVIALACIVGLALIAVNA
jgi:hypothetical protein